MADQASGISVASGVDAPPVSAREPARSVPSVAPVAYSAYNARAVADWIRDAVIYEINTRAFSASGNFAGVIARLDDLKRLGVTVLWLMPIQPSGQVKKKGSHGSPYAIRDYDGVNPELGTADEFKQLVREAHARGLRVIIDIVANHTAWDCVLMEHPEYYRRDAQGRILSPLSDWADAAGLDYTSAALREYMTSMLERWLADYDLDGFRCDVAGMVPTDFWEQARARLEAVKSDILLLAEWNAPELMVHAFDVDYAWPFHKTLTEVIEFGKNASAIRDVWEQERARFPRGTLHMVFSDNHDEKRAIARFGERGALAASALVFAMEGVPMIYNGMEVGDTAESGAPALFERAPIFWKIVERRPEFPRAYQTLIRLRRDNAALRRGELAWIQNSDETRIVSFARRYEDVEIVFAVNLSNRPFLGTLRKAGRTGCVDVMTGKPADAAHLQLEAWEWRMYRRSLRR